MLTLPFEIFPACDSRMPYTPIGSRPVSDASASVWRPAPSVPTSRVSTRRPARSMSSSVAGAFEGSEKLIAKPAYAGLGNAPCTANSVNAGISTQPWPAYTSRPPRTKPSR